mmetsp:Transcript_22897/g.29323  ORF Transcript_22897/g.29323 Transcript_22897/m.29323 type:complete len:266 (-) Transcript_22897:25-822(-)
MCLMILFLLNWKANWTCSVDEAGRSLGSSSSFFLPVCVFTGSEASTSLFEWERIPAMPQLTGIPPHVLVFIEFHQLEIHYENIIEHVDENPARTLNLIRDHLDSRQNSNLGINLQAMLDDKFSQLSDQIIRSHRAQEEQEEQERNGNGEDGEDKWTLFSWQDGSTHVLPIFAMSSKDMARHGRTCRNRYNEFKFLMEEVERIGRNKNCWKRNHERWDLQLVIKLQDAVREAFMFGQHRSVDRTMQHTWRTIYRKVRAKKLAETPS